MTHSVKELHFTGRDGRAELLLLVVRGAKARKRRKSTGHRVMNSRPNWYPPGLQHEETPMFQATSDGTIRMSVAELASLRLCHDSSGLYSENSPVTDCGRTTDLVGFTEWIAEDARGCVVTLSWDWRIDPFTGKCSMDGLPYSNIELVDENGGNIDWRTTLTRLADYVGSIRWAESVRSVIE